MSVSPQTHERYERVFADVEAPFAFVDLEAMWGNADSMLERSQGKRVRVASKSVRCRALLEAILARDERFRGLMTYTLPETLWLAEQGFEDLLLAYPTADVGALEELALRSAAGPQGAPTVVVDCSGFYAPVSFDHYSRFELTPAAAFALPVTRKPSEWLATAPGGGYLAAGLYLRHAKAGELCERFATLLLVEGDEIVDEVPTYRGDGKSFL